MTPEEIAGLGGAFTEFLDNFKGCFFRREVIDHFRTYCRGLLSDLPRKSVEPIALAAGATVRSLQEFLAHLQWDHGQMRDRIQQRIAQRHGPVPGQARRPGDPGAIGLIDECGQPKKGDHTPGVKRQYCGASGKIDNCIVNVHLSYCHGDFKTLIDSDLFLPQDWSDDRPRCREAHIPDEVIHRPKPAIALEQVRRALANGLRFDFFTFDEEYGRSTPFLMDLERAGQLYVAEVPNNFHCWPTLPKYHSSRKEFAAKEVRHVVRWSPVFYYQPWESKTLARQTLAPQSWDIRAAQVYLRHPDTGRPTERTYWLIAGWNRDTHEYKYWVSNAPASTSLELLLKVAFRRAVVEHLFRIAKTEIGLDHYEGRSYPGLMRHLILCQLVLLFLAEQTIRLRGEKRRRASSPHPRRHASVTRIQRQVAPPLTPSGTRPAPLGHGTDHGADGPGPQQPLPTLDAPAS